MTTPASPTEDTLIQIRTLIGSNNPTAALALIESASSIPGAIWFELLVQKLRCFILLKDTINATAVANSIIAIPSTKLDIIKDVVTIAGFTDALVNFILMQGSSCGFLDPSLEPFKAFIKAFGSYDTVSNGVTLMNFLQTLWLSQQDYASQTPTDVHFQDMQKMLEPAIIDSIKAGYPTYITTMAKLLVFAATSKDAQTQATIAALTNPILA